MSLTDSRRMWKLAAERGRAGLHSHDARRLGITGNPSQRAKDIADRVPFWTKRQARNGRPGSLYFTDGNQPSDALPVKPNGPEGGGGTLGQARETPAAPLSVEAAPSQVGIKQPTAIVRDWDGVFKELPWDEERREAA